MFKLPAVKIITVILVFISISFISIGYSAFNTELTISGEVAVTAPDMIYVSNIELIETTNTTEMYTPTLTKETVDFGINIPAGTSSFTYEVTITNTSSSFYHLNQLNELHNSNPSATYLIYDLYIYDEFAPNSETKFQITYVAGGAVPSLTELEVGLQFVFHPGAIYKDETLNGSDPVLIDGLIPIVYNEDLATWVKADVLREQWYDYDTLQWANAASVVPSKRAYYVSSEPGTVIPMEDIISMLVWIPRYSYTVRDILGYQGYDGNAVTINTPGAFNIEFHGTETINTGNAKYTGTTPTNWYTNPAFCWGNTCDDPATRTEAGNVEIPGFWIAKFEAAKQGNILYSKPNMTPMNYINIQNTFTFVQDLMNGMNGYNNYGYVGYVDAHLIKNTEWGAIAYLTQSRYGKYGNTDYVGVYKEVYPNNCSLYITGIGGDAPSVTSTEASCTDNTYETYEGKGASTTGNIYGVYDMVGGTFDRVMGTVLDTNGNLVAGASGFTADNLPEGRYINIYENAHYGLSTTTSIRGDALTDTLGFYQDRGVTSSYLSYSWFYRGGSLYGNVTTINGIFSYTTYTGQADLNHSSRFTITIY